MLNSFILQSLFEASASDAKAKEDEDEKKKKKKAEDPDKKLDDASTDDNSADNQNEESPDEPDLTKSEPTEDISATGEEGTDDAGTDDTNPEDTSAEDSGSDDPTDTQPEDPTTDSSSEEGTDADPETDDFSLDSGDATDGADDTDNPDGLPSPDDDGSGDDMTDEQAEKNVHVNILQLSKLDRALAKRRCFSDYQELRTSITSTKAMITNNEASIDPIIRDYATKKLDRLFAMTTDYLSYKFVYINYEENLQNYLLFAKALNDILQYIRTDGKYPIDGGMKTPGGKSKPSKAKKDHIMKSGDVANEPNNDTDGSDAGEDFDLNSD